MKKMKRSIVMLLVLLLTFATFVPVNAASQTVISKTKVRSIVRKNTTSLKKKTLTLTLKTDDGVKYYEVTGKTSGRKYEFEVDAYSGKILAKEWKARTIKKGKKKLTKAQARKVVNKKVVAKKSQKNYTIKTDYEKGIKCYEIEFKTSTRKYDVVVNATTGTLYEVDWDLLKKTQNVSTGTTTSTSVTKTEATTIAKNELKSQLGLTDAQAENIKVVEVEYEKENGRYVYSIELRYGRYECDVEVEASTGNIVDFDLEIDD